MLCKVCGVKEVTRPEYSGMCPGCRYHKYKYGRGYHCDMCGIPVSDQNEHQRCKKCTGLAKRQRIQRTCGHCGKPIEVHPYEARDQKNSFCSKACCNEWQRQTSPQMGENSHNYIDGPRLSSAGYVMIYQADGPKNHRRRFEHVLVAEAALGRKLKRDEVVHHINLNKADNRNCNLLICSNAYHRWLHHQMEVAWVREHFPG